MKNILILTVLCFAALAGCAGPGPHGPNHAIEVNGVTYDDNNWNGR